MTPSGPFLVTCISRADNSLAVFSLHKRTLFCFASGQYFITRGPLPAGRADLLRLRGPLPLVSGPFSFSRIQTDIVGSFSLRLCLFSQHADLFCSEPFLTISAMTRANRVDSLGALKRFWSVTSASRTDFFVRTDL